MSLIKKSIIKVKLSLPSGSISVGPPVSTVLGQYRIDINQFCRSFNDKTKHMEKETLLPVKILLKTGNIIKFDIATPSTSYLLKRSIAGLSLKNDKKLNNLMLYKIFNLKLIDNGLSDISLLRNIKGTIKSFQINKYHLN